MVIRALSLACNLIMVCWTCGAVYRGMHRNKDGEFIKKPSPFTFRYFTTDSNVLAGLCALLVAIFDVRILFGAIDALPQWVLLVKFVGTVAVSVTLLTVLAFLGPTQGYKPLFSGDGLYLHLIGPLLAIISFGFFETDMPITFVQSLLGLLPTMVYGAVYLIIVVKIGESRGGWEDFYGFNAGGKWPLSFAMMHIGTLAICVGNMFLHNALA